ncbi:MAG TPA: sigma 54-interacting transcriptional regulator [Polyangia bacterium]|jgi:MoxR-like ATPase|nr:sigma 54-interacting transcriptional regulator [Polyangia bacterium]
MVARVPANNTDEASRTQRSGTRIPGLVVIFSGRAPTCLPVPLHKGGIVLGRTPADGVLMLADEHVSRRQARISVGAGRVRVTDLGSRTGTFVDGRPIGDEVFETLPRILRLGHTLLRFTPDIAPFLAASGVRSGGSGIEGPLMRGSRLQIERAAAAGDAVLITGPRGSGKELAARIYHAATRRKGPFVTVHCAALPARHAEQLLFGQRDAASFAQAAEGGTLFLDEITALDEAVQPRFLRMIEHREVLESGALQPRPIDVRICAATRKDLSQEVAARRFRDDLYRRLGPTEVRLPALAERLEELPYLAAAELERIDPRLTADALFLEAAALRPWPGNVREFLCEVRQSARAALEAERTVVEAADLAPTAGQSLPPEEAPKALACLSRVTVEEALRRERGNVTRAARALGLPRSQLRRWITREGIEPARFLRASGDRQPGNEHLGAV